MSQIATTSLFCLEQGVKSDHGLVNSLLALALKHGILPASVAHGAANLT